MDAREIALRGEILRATVGSSAHGISVNDQDDRDEMGVCIEPPEYVIGLKRFDQLVYRTQPEGTRSGPGDLDLTIYSLRKYMRLALAGNPTVIIPLYASDYVANHLGERLRRTAPYIVSRQAGRRFLGYLQSQRQRLLGERGQARLPHRPELVDKYGFDTKYAGHMLRLALQGVELLETGRLHLPMSEPNRQAVLAVRTGQCGLEDTLAGVAALERTLLELTEGDRPSPLPEQPDHESTNRFLEGAYLSHWASQMPF